MFSKEVLEAIDTSFYLNFYNDVPFCEHFFVFEGDFRQTLSILPQCTGQNRYESSPYKQHESLQWAAQTSIVSDRLR